ncbi:ATP synthase subunit b [Bienertia sinuspersici]
MGAAAAFTDEFVLKSCLVIILDVPESFREKFRKKPKHVISLDDDDDDDDSIDNRDGSCNTNNDVTTSDRCHSTHGARPSTSASVEEKDVIEGNTPVRLSKSKRTYSGKNISRNKYGLSPDSEGCSSESDCSDCELMEGSLEKLREQWEKASLRRRHDATCVCPEVGNTAGTSGPSHPVYDYAEEGTSEESEPLGQQNEQHYDPMEVDGQSPRACDNFMSSGRDDKAKGGALASECSLHYSSEKCVDRHMEPLGDLNDSAQKLGEQFKFPGQNCDSKIPNEVCSRDYSADLIKKPSQVAESNHAALFDRQGAGIPSMPSELKSKCGHLNEGLCSSGENGIITDRQKIKETELFKHAQEEELAARQEQLLRQCASCLDCKDTLSFAHYYTLDQALGSLNENHSRRQSGRQGKKPHLEVLFFAEKSFSSLVIGSLDSMEMGANHRYEKRGRTDEPRSGSFVPNHETNATQNAAVRESDRRWLRPRLVLPLSQTDSASHLAALASTRNPTGRGEEKVDSAFSKKKADEAQRLRARKRAEKMRLMMNEKRQQQRVEEIRQSRRKDEENLNLKEKHRVQAAYKQACLKFHPDRISTTDLRQQVEAEEKFKLISNMKDKFLSKR